VADNVLQFTTPARQRDEQPIDVDLIGQRFTVKRPKDAVLFFAQTAAGDVVADSDRARAVLQFVQAVLDAPDRHRFFERCLDRNDPLNLQTALSFMAAVVEKWGDWPARTKRANVVVSEVEPNLFDAPDPITVEHKDLNVRFTAHPPKDIVLMFVQASLATGSQMGEIAWALSLFLDGALDHQDAVVIANRMRSPRDQLDLEHIAEMVSSLVTAWTKDTPTGNRAARRNTNRQGGRRVAPSRGSGPITTSRGKANR
jgi:hypothetical protein